MLYPKAPNRSVPCRCGESIYAGLAHSFGEIFIRNPACGVPDEMEARIVPKAQVANGSAGVGTEDNNAFVRVRLNILA